MSEIMIDIIGQILWVAMFATPFITIPFVWRTIKVHKSLRIIIGLALACFISFLLHFISLALIFRDGFGATVTTNTYPIADIQDSVVKAIIDHLILQNYL